MMLSLANRRGVSPDRRRRGRGEGSRTTCQPLVTAVVLGVSFLIGAPDRASAQRSMARHTKLSLVAREDAVKPGLTLTVGIRLRMEPGWHTYWRNPGDSGLPTRVKWTLPTGFEAGEIRWPHPIRFSSGSLVSYGYEREVLLPVEIRTPPAIAARQVRLTARVDWLECKGVCLPGKTELSLTLPVRKAASSGRNAAAFAEARRQFPVADPAWRFRAAAADRIVSLSVLPPRGTTVDSAYFYAVTRRLLDYSRPQPLERVTAGVRLLLPRDPNGTSSERLAGVLVVEAGGRQRALEVDVPLGTR